MFIVEISGSDGTKTWERPLRVEAIDLAKAELRDKRRMAVARVKEKSTANEVWSASKGADGVMVE